MIGLRRPVGAVGCAVVAVVAVVVVVCFAVAPNVTAAALVVWWVLRAKVPDRLLALAVLVAWTPAAWSLWAVSPTWGPLWWRVVVGWPVGMDLAEDVTAWLLTGGSWGPWIAAGLWLLTQRRREHNPYSGRDETEARQRQEERRRLWTVQTAHRLVAISDSRAVRRVARLFTIPPGDPAGPYLGRVQRGDLAGAWRAGPTATERLPGPLRWIVTRLVGRRLRLPVGEVHHAAVLGATGTGKSELIHNVAEWALRAGWRVFYLSAKEPAPADSVAPRLASVAAAGSTLR